MSVRYGEITFRPIDGWPGEETMWRQRSPFSSAWGKTIALLERELDLLDATNVVLQIAVDERDLRLDGKPRSNAKPRHPGVIVAFDSKHGPLKYAVDTYTHFSENVRAIALALEHLRAVDRYGVTRRGEQYTGWRAIPAATGLAGMTRDEALEVLDPWQGDWKAAARATHPDHGGDTIKFQRVMRAREVLA